MRSAVEFDLCLHAFFRAREDHLWSIIHLTKVAVQVSSEGDYLLRAQRFTDDEAGMLIDQFNAMMDRIQQRDSALKLAHDGLEETVKIRTGDLRREIAERKLVQSDLELAKTTAELANRAKSSFLATMSHELRTPLNAIIGYSEILYEDAEISGNREMVQDLQKVLASARHLLSLISDVLDLSKIEAGEMKLSVERVLASSLLADVYATAEILAKKNGNTIRLLDASWDGLVSVDPIRFRQCLLNLLSNSCKFTEDELITIAIRRKEFGGKEWILWSVADTGMGISESGRLKLFRTFSQVDSSSTRKHGGTGLGLAISQQLCHAMQGHITVESEPGKGSMFTIHIPA